MNDISPQPSGTPVKKRPWWARLRPTAVLTVLVVLLLIGGGVGVLVSTHKRTPQAASSTHVLAKNAASSGQWVTIQTFNGSGTKKTAAFTVSNNWRIVWSCDLSSHSNTNYYVVIHANTTTNTLLDNSVETTCSKSNLHSFSQIHQGGKVYLSILSQGSWRVQVQDLK